MQKSRFELEEERDEKRFLDSLTPFQRLVDNHWTFVFGVILAWIISFGVGLLVGMFL